MYDGIDRLHGMSLLDFPRQGEARPDELLNESRLCASAANTIAQPAVGQVGIHARVPEH